ncbi:MAG: hypothetical protein JWO79_3533 [Actinomycetia bacterium]|jgi:hypothetical protein|nr:hypothetical protein [Actinomycetes bacterium]MDQ1652813.1 hypothetical protein [Cryptosporangiaceae bacterium]MDQ1659321.1 hypothetical protein [Cryptosporangiaceae bacterium]
MTNTTVGIAADNSGPLRDLGHFWVMSIAVHMDSDGVVPLPGDRYQLPEAKTFRVMDLWCPQCRRSYADAGELRCTAFTDPVPAAPPTATAPRRACGGSGRPGGIASLSWRLRHR